MLPVLPSLANKQIQTSYESNPLQSLYLFSSRNAPVENALKFFQFSSTKRRVKQLTDVKGVHEEFWEFLMCLCFFHESLPCSVLLVSSLNLATSDIPKPLHKFPVIAVSEPLHASGGGCITRYHFQRVTSVLMRTEYVTMKRRRTIKTQMPKAVAKNWLHCICFLCAFKRGGTHPLISNPAI